MILLPGYFRIAFFKLAGPLLAGWLGAGLAFPVTAQAAPLNAANEPGSVQSSAHFPDLSAADQGGISNARAGRRYGLERAEAPDPDGPFGSGLPLATFGSNGSRLLFTYLPRMKDAATSGVFMFYIRMNLD